MTYFTPKQIRMYERMAARIDYHKHERERERERQLTLEENNKKLSTIRNSTIDYNIIHFK